MQLVPVLTPGRGIKIPNVTWFNNNNNKKAANLCFPISMFRTFTVRTVNSFSVIAVFHFVVFFHALLWVTGTGSFLQFYFYLSILCSSVSVQLQLQDWIYLYAHTHSQYYHRTETKADVIYQFHETEKPSISLYPFTLPHLYYNCQIFPLRTLRTTSDCYTFCFARRWNLEKLKRKSSLLYLLTFLLTIVFIPSW